MKSSILYKLICVSATGPGAGGAAAAAITDSPSLAVEFTETKPAIVAWWGSNVGTGFHQLTPQSGHDTTRGLRKTIIAGEERMFLRRGKIKPVRSLETLTYSIGGHASAVEYGCLLMAYPGRGESAQFLNYDELNRFTEHGKETTIVATLDTTAEGFSGKETFKAENNLLIAGRRYAITGMTTTVERAALTLEGPDFGDVRIGMPGDSTNPERAEEWFVDLSRDTGLPCIPTFNTGNLDNLYIGCVGRAADADAVVTLHLELLREGAGK